MSQIIDLEIDGSDENLTGRLIGQGSYGIVTKSYWRDQNVAIKRFPSDARSFKAELENLKRVDHENIIKCLAFKKSENLIMMEFAENGSLHQLLHSPRYSNVSYNIAHALNWSLQVAKGVQYLHSIKPKLIIHRDLKPLNILLMNNFTKIKICDFGTACNIKTLMTQVQGSIAYMSPEVIRGSSYNEKCDVFSWSIILWELFSRRIPYSTIQTDSQSTQGTDNTNESTNCTTVGAGPYAIMWAIAKGDRPKLLKNCPKVFEDLLHSCWQESPAERPSFNEIVDKMDNYLNIVKDFLTPIDSSRIVPEDSQHSYFNFNLNNIQINSCNNQNRTFVKKNHIKNIPDNVELEPHCEMIKICKNNSNETPVLEHYINYTPSMEPVDEVSDNRPLKILNIEKLDHDASEKDLKYVSTIETQVDSANGDSDSFLASDCESGDITCGIGSFLNPKLISFSGHMTRILNPQTQSHTIFYTNELDSKFATLTPNDETAQNDKFSEKTVTKHMKQNHRSEIEINCKLNSSACSTISSSSTSIVNGDRMNDTKESAIDNISLTKGQARSNEEVDELIDSNNSSTHLNEEDGQSSDEYPNRMSSSLSSFESIDKENIKEQIAQEMPNGGQIKYNFDKKKRGLVSMKTFKRVFRKDYRHVPSDL